MLNMLHYLSSILYSTFVTNEHKRLLLKFALEACNSQNEALQTPYTTCLANVLERTLVECRPTARTNRLSLSAEILTVPRLTSLEMVRQDLR